MKPMPHMTCANIALCTTRFFTWFFFNTQLKYCPLNADDDDGGGMMVGWVNENNNNGQY